MSPMFRDFRSLPPSCHIFTIIGLWSNVTFWQIPLPQDDIIYGQLQCRIFLKSSSDFLKYKRTRNKYPKSLNFYYICTTYMWSIFYWKLFHAFFLNVNDVFAWFFIIMQCHYCNLTCNIMGLTRGPFTYRYFCCTHTKNIY